MKKMTKRARKEFNEKFKKAEKSIEVGLKMFRPDNKVLTAFQKVAEEPKRR